MASINATKSTVPTINTRSKKTIGKNAVVKSSVGTPPNTLPTSGQLYP